MVRGFWRRQIAGEGDEKKGGQDAQQLLVASEFREALVEDSDELDPRSA
jgi:hypothetical protein